MDVLLDADGEERAGPIAVRINVFADVAPTVTLTRVEGDPVSWTGTLGGTTPGAPPPGEARIVRVAQSFMLSLTIGLQRFEASQLPDGRYLVIEIDPAGGRPD